MLRRSLGAVLAALLTTALLTTPPAAATTTDLAGTVALSNCSGSLVRPADAPEDAPALVLSNGHCLARGFPQPGQVIVDEPVRRTFTLLAADGAELTRLTSTRLLYATMTGTDIALYRLADSYADIERAHGVRARVLAEAGPEAGTRIGIPSGYWKRTYTCSVDDTVHELREAGYTWQHSIRYTPACDTIGGTSGSPIVDVATGQVVGVNNTGNTEGQRCTLNNPCEVAEDGEITVRKGASYGQQTFRLPACLSAMSELEPDLPRCDLPGVSRRAVPA
ncbi:trypsin-like peptidase [Prauserella shujinwangii]|uniref:Trypsin-like peptidase n=1 Tax=Prauserella shujinwangii TaxID=1453103 RepID=A0A2T0M1U8_9PSEU|nr:serine protease [Prauserella shujinwangii]PRX50541.1 trypsin-like peptidase [Prauserella shujinwangii]